MERLVTSLDLSLKLKAAGIVQEANYYWVKNSADKWVLSRWKTGYFDERTAAAFLSEEILEKLPMPIDKGGGLMYRLWINREPVKDRIELIYVNAKNSDDYFLTVADSLTEAAGKMWLYLAEHQLLKGEDK